MNCLCDINKKRITIVRGNDTDWNGSHLLTVNLNTELFDLSNIKAVFVLEGIKKEIETISDGIFTVDLTAEETSQLPLNFKGIEGSLSIIDAEKRIATITNSIPFIVIDKVNNNAIATEPYTLNFDVEQGGETILNVSVESAVTVEVGTTTTLPAGSDATVTNVGTNNHLVLNFGIPEGNGIVSIEKTSTTGLVDTYTVTFDEGNTTTFDVTNGSSIASIQKTSTSGLVDTYTITLTNGDTSTFTVTNGKDGVDGVDGVSPTASVTPTSSGATITITDAQGTTTANITNGQDGTDGTNATITGATASVTNTVGTPSVTVTAGGTESARSFDFAFTNLKGDKGDKGDTGSGLIATVVSELPTTGETGRLYLVPKTTPAQEDIYDEYIWALVSENPDTYDWEHIGSTEIDLSGYVQSVNNITPDNNGNVTIDTTTPSIVTLSATDSITLADNTIFNGGTLTSLTIALWAIPTVAFISEILFTSGATATTVSYPNTIKWLGDDIENNVFTATSNKRYTIMFYYDGAKTVAVAKGL